jgi:hypothetical protein
VLGTSYSKDLALRLDDGEPLALGDDYQVTSPERILVILPETIGAGSHSVVVRNPEGLETPPASFSLSGP